MTATRAFQWVGLLEGLSYLVLLLVAMPLKYYFGYPLATRIVGSLHGLLTVLFVLALYAAHRENRWSLGRNFAFFVSSLIPLGFVWMELSLKKELAAKSAPVRAS